MNKSLQGKVALVTGGSRNIGRNVAMALGAQGADVVLTYREREAEAQRAVVELQGLGVRADALQVDLTGSAQLPKLIDAFKSVLARWQRPQFDILINNAGALRLGSFEEITEADIDHIYRTNYKSVFFLTQQLGPLLMDGGRISSRSAVARSVRTSSRVLIHTPGTTGTRSSIDNRSSLREHRCRLRQRATVAIRARLYAREVRCDLRAFSAFDGSEFCRR